MWRALLKPGQSVSDLRRQVRDEMAAAEELARLEAIWKLLKEQGKVAVWKAAHGAL